MTTIHIEKVTKTCRERIIHRHKLTRAAIHAEVWRHTRRHIQPHTATYIQWE